MFRRQARWPAGSLVAVALLTIAWGCGGGAPPVSTSTTEAAVSGTVTIKGKRATRGDVIFDPSNVQRQVTARSAHIGKDGTYTITTLVGQNRVKVISPELGRGRELDDVDLYYEVQSGANSYNIVLPPPD